MAADHSKPATSRRGILAAAPALALVRVPPVAATPVSVPLAAEVASAGLTGPDRDLLRLCAVAVAASDAESVAMERFGAAELCADRAVCAEAQEAQEAAWDEYESALSAMAEIPAASFTGVAVKISATVAFREQRGGVADVEFLLLAGAAEDATRLLANLALPVPPAVPAASPDASLLRLVDRWASLSAELRGLDEAEGGLAIGGPRAKAVIAAMDSLGARRRQALRAIADAPAATRRGRAAKAEILRDCIEGRDDPVSLLAASLARDLVGGSVA
ncbi:hypothetical protein HB662_26920 [Roseomonas frigidaquae]|uniref:Uncharacterized protein n=1 Tax=Falsiroseomonas frigidaquae TaxID=487318 RepID=A0ABX1F7Y6_9PROT|nr:hypothetical protein [Falsiroseomonas frigidaquae]NKE48435.1 hypothetical protein [Falsiroseomonas frigidaquae]